MTTSPLDLDSMRSHAVAAENLKAGAHVTNAELLALLDRVEEAERMAGEWEKAARYNAESADAFLTQRQASDARAEAAEKKVAAVRELRDKWFRELENPEHLVYLETVINDLDYTLDTHTPETETTP